MDPVPMLCLPGSTWFITSASLGLLMCAVASTWPCPLCVDPVGLGLMAEGTAWTGMTLACRFVHPRGAPLLLLFPKDLVTLLNDWPMNKARSTAGRSVWVIQKLMVDLL